MRHDLSATRVTSRRGLFVGSAAALVGAGLTACTTSTTVAAESADAPNEADIGFCTDMAFHHEQALAMCQRVLGSDTGGSVQNSAAEILQNQSYERGLLHAWLASWGQSTAPPSEVMGWMGMSMPAETMPGLASADEMRALAELTGIDKGREFLVLMRTHHVGGIHMADMAVDMAAISRVKTIAQQMSAQQSYEIAMFDSLLETTYA
ncbi:DUF305 domain-containing protein [Microbacterium sp. NPDC076911]|uniref:DUF305 domain-containing protein n=1 Tax=unclassified Microbacterium TaxID=2609290 RepID=UPI00343FA94E